MNIKHLTQPGSQAAYFRNSEGRHLCEVVEHPSFASLWTWVRYPDEVGSSAYWRVPVNDLTPVGPVARELLRCRR